MKVHDFVAGLFDDSDGFHIGEVKDFTEDGCLINFMHRLKRTPEDRDKYWVFPSIEDKHHLKFPSIMDIKPQIDLVFGHELDHQ